jgi:imidazolonepropionase-like amidohydrolase
MIGAFFRKASFEALTQCSTTTFVLGLVFSASVLSGAEAPRAVTEYRGGHVFTGEGFVETALCVEGATIVTCDGKATSVVNLEGGFIIPPFADAHTHHFDGPYTFAWHRSSSLDAGVFYAMTMTAPVSGILQIRDQLSGSKNVDVATALGGITGPESHPAEIYEAVALGILSYEEQVARAEEIRSSQKMADDAYFVMRTAAEAKEKWPIILDNDPDLIKVFLRSSERYREGYGKWGPGGGLDPGLLPLIRKLSQEAGLRLAVANSSLADFRASVAANADFVTHLPCYQDSMSDPESPYYSVDTDENCELSRADADAAAAIGMGSVLITSEWAKERPEVYVGWEKHNVGLLEAAGAPLAIGSNAYGATVIDGLVAGAQKRFFEPARLLRLATTDTARLIFPNRRAACLEQSCEASFLVLEGNPLEDFSRIRAIRLRVKDGEPLAKEEIQGG